MLFLLFGSSGSGKTVALGELARREVSGLAIHDFDEIGVPPAADTAWRRGANAVWIEHALELESQSVDLLLAGQTPFGELLASPAAGRLGAISGCLLDCDDATRLARLSARGATWQERAGAELTDYLAWATWLRAHAANPTARPEVIRGEVREDGLHWERWSSWLPGDRRWRVRVLDTTMLGPVEVANELKAWVTAERAARDTVVIRSRVAPSGSTTTRPERGGGLSVRGHCRAHA